MNACLQVMDSLYQTRVKKGETDLLIEQLREVLHFLTNSHKVSNSQSCLSSQDEHCHHWQGQCSTASTHSAFFSFPLHVHFVAADQHAQG